MSRRLEYILLALIFIVALLIRLYISTVYYGTSADEYANIYLTRNTFESGFMSYPDQFMWLYYFLSASLLLFIKDAFLATKIITIFFGATSLIVIYFVAKKIFNGKIAFLSLFLLLIHPQFTLISSTPLREPVYTFFVFLGILFLVNDWIISGAFSIALAFLTRMEALWINMPSYILSAVSLKRFKFSLFIILVGVFILAILFMNTVVNQPFGYLQEIIKEQHQFHPISNFSVINFFSSLNKFARYILTLIGLNVFFMVVGLFELLCRFKRNKPARVFMIFMGFNMFFWILYIFFYKELVNQNYRYLYVLIPFFIVLVSLGFFTIFDRVKRKSELIFLFTIFILSGYPIYFIYQGRVDIQRSMANQRLTELSLWIEENIQPSPANRILIDGTPFFYMHRFKNDYDLIKVELVKEEIKGGLENLLSFLDRQKIRYVVWTKDDRASREALFCLKDQEQIKNLTDWLIPVASVGDGEAIVYKYIKHE